MRWFLVALLALAACVAHTPARDLTPKSYYHASPLIKLRLHADVEFTPLERGLIQRAIDDLEWQTAGWLLVDLEYDLDFNDPAVLLRGNLLVREPVWAPLTLKLDIQKGGQLLGFTFVEKRQAYLVADRLTTPDLWRHVAMHEILHIAGLDDLPTTETEIMALRRVPKVPVCMSRADAGEFCRVNFCDPERLNYCGRSPRTKDSESS